MVNIESNQKHDFLGFEISDVLRISDKDYSVTFGLYFSVEWFEPRLNLSRDLWGEGRVASDTELIPGEFYRKGKKENNSANSFSLLWSKFGKKKKT